ncbi:MAG: hypothetical protein H0V49_03360 [Nocardioidaceae bacterium]|nr:hypothetical protein [Nocardioidaceae bacterium]
MTHTHDEDDRAVSGEVFDEEVGTEGYQETVGQSDAVADAARAGADVEGLGGDDVQRDTDGTPVGAADADEDARRAGA